MCVNTGRHLESLSLNSTKHTHSHAILVCTNKSTYLLTSASKAHFIFQRPWFFSVVVEKTHTALSFGRKTAQKCICDGGRKLSGSSQNVRHAFLRCILYVCGVDNASIS